MCEMYVNFCICRILHDFIKSFYKMDTKFTFSIRQKLNYDVYCKQDIMNIAILTVVASMASAH